MCLFLRADEHESIDFFRQFGDELIDEIVLRMDEVRSEFRSVSHHLVAHEVQQRVSIVLALGNLHHTVFLHRASHLQEGTVRDGTDGGGGFHHDILHHTDIHVTVGTYQFLVRTGRDVFVDIHRVVEGTVTTARPHQVERGGKVAGGDGVESAYATGSHWCCHDTGEGVQSAARAEGEGYTSTPRHIHLV